jgi:predicted ABC-type ATPase
LGNPSLLMIAGPNGSGKTTISRILRENGVDFGEYVNPDEIADGLQGCYEERVRQAQLIADRKREACITARRSFSFETVMSHPSKIDILVRAKAAGFFVQLFFVGTDDPQTNIERVALRVAQGGHDVPADRIVSRWKRTMALLGDAIRASDRSFVFDNSAAGNVDVGPRLIFTLELGKDGRIEPRLRVNPPPDWVRTYALDPLGISFPTIRPVR